MEKLNTVIVGGGLAGLYAAHLLARQGVRDLRVLEARPHWGGRILSVAAEGVTGTTAPAAHRFDLGPTWYWPAYQPELDAVVRELGLQTFDQHEAGDMVVERSATQPPVRTAGYASAPPSVRLVGGMAALVDALVADLRQRLVPAALCCGTTVRQLTCDADGVTVTTQDAQGATTTCHAQQVLLAVPPRLATDRLRFEPALPPALVHAWRGTVTWMAPHAKYLAVYATPFWREQGLSGEARSGQGPMGEIHDASAHGGPAALFGFLGVPASVRLAHSPEVIRTHCRAQLVRLFGPKAANPVAEFLQDWAADPWTATQADLSGPATHGEAPPASAHAGAWAGRLVGVGSEWSPQYPGYLAGAIEAARLGVESLLHSAETARL